MLNFSTSFRFPINDTRFKFKEKKKSAPHAVSCICSDADSPKFMQRSAQVQAQEADFLLLLPAKNYCTLDFICKCEPQCSHSSEPAALKYIKKKIKKTTNKNHRAVYCWFAGGAVRVASARDTAFPCTAGCML